MAAHRLPATYLNLVGLAGYSTVSHWRHAIVTTKGTPLGVPPSAFQYQQGTGGIECTGK